MRRVLRFIFFGLGALLLLAALGFGFLYWRISNPTKERLPLPQELISLESEEGRLLLASAERADYEALVSHFETQQKGSWCGVASAVMTLNSFGGGLTQDSLFNDCANDARHWLRVTFGGMPLGVLGQLLACHGAKAELHYAEESSLEKFRALAEENLRTPGDVLIVNYQRALLGQGELGHISPIAAYHRESDRFLVLDVASYKYPPVWVKAETLFAAMNTPDSESGRSRGFVLVRP